MVGEPQYQEFYRRLFPEGATDVFSLLGDPAHREIHRKLQAVLDADSDDSDIVAGVIDIAARQIEARTLLERIEQVDLKDNALGTAARALAHDQKHQKLAKQAVTKPKRH